MAGQANDTNRSLSFAIEAYTIEVLPLVDFFRVPSGFVIVTTNSFSKFRPIIWQCLPPKSLPLIIVINVRSLVLTIMCSFIAMTEILDSYGLSPHRYRFISTEPSFPVDINSLRLNDWNVDTASIAR